MADDPIYGSIRDLYMQATKGSKQPYAMVAAGAYINSVLKTSKYQPGGVYLITRTEITLIKPGEEDDK